MRKMDAAKAAGLIGADLYGNPAAAFTSVVRDNRDVTPGALFTAIVGEKLDGHRFAADAFARGASVCLVQKGNPYLDTLSLTPEQALIITEEDTVTALQKLAGAYRSTFAIPVVGITGSVGKTSTKDLTAAALSGKFRVKKTQGNYNNQIGVPLTLFGWEEDTEAAVVEMGMDHANQIDYISQFVRPDYAVITNIGISHIENFENREGILAAKLEITHHLNPAGCLFMNGDDPRLAPLKGKLPVASETFGLGEENDARVLSAVMTDAGLAVTAAYEDETYVYTLNTIGMHMALNSLPGLMVAKKLGLTKEEIQNGLSSFELTEKRLQLKTSGRFFVIDDSYNASPDSMKSGLGALVQLNRGTRKVAVLGDMFELGAQEESGHRLVGSLAAETPELSLAIFVGTRMKLAYEEAGSMGNKARWFETLAEAENALPALLRDGDAVLVKASHGMHFDTLCSFILSL